MSKRSDPPDPPDPDLFGYTPPPDRSFGGKTYDPARDYVRLTGQLHRTWKVMLDGHIRTLRMIANETTALRTDGGRDSEAAISARLRDFRKLKFGGHNLEAYNGGGGLWWYRLILITPEPDPNPAKSPANPMHNANLPNTGTA